MQRDDLPLDGARIEIERPEDATWMPAREGARWAYRLTIPSGIVCVGLTRCSRDALERDLRLLARRLQAAEKNRSLS